MISNNRAGSCASTLVRFRPVIVVPPSAPYSFFLYRPEVPVCCCDVSEVVRCQNLNSEAQVQSQSVVRVIRSSTEVVVGIYRRIEVVVGVTCQLSLH
jgi:hypothetical protein